MYNGHMLKMPACVECSIFTAQLPQMVEPGVGGGPLFRRLKAGIKKASSDEQL